VLQYKFCGKTGAEYSHARAQNVPRQGGRIVLQLILMGRNKYESKTTHLFYIYIYIYIYIYRERDVCHLPPAPSPQAVVMVVRAPPWGLRTLWVVVGDGWGELAAALGLGPHLGWGWVGGWGVGAALGLGEWVGGPYHGIGVGPQELGPDTHMYIYIYTYIHTYIYIYNYILTYICIYFIFNLTWPKIMKRVFVCILLTRARPGMEYQTYSEV